ncbi:MAG: hypothetical protein RI955_1525 [Bacteroidota bacterium]|jgi:hypothetical protein
MQVKHYIYSLIFTLFGGSSFAQITFTSQVPIGISTAKDVLFVGGDLINQSSANLVNNGKLYVTENITNEQANMTTGVGTLYLKGTKEQSISGTKIFNTYNLNTDNKEGIVLNTNMSVANLHIFSNGIITTAATPTFLIYKSNATYTGDDDSKHINGTVKKYGSADFDFPVGNGSVERKAGLRNVSESSVFSCSYHQDAPSSKSLNKLTSTNDKEYWNINQNEKYHATANIALNWNHEKVAYNDVQQKKISQIKVSHMVNENWNNEGGKALGNVSSAGQIVSGLLTSFGNFSLGTTDEAETAETMNKKLIESAALKVDNNHYKITFTIENENGEGAYEISVLQNGEKVKLTEIVATNELIKNYTSTVELLEIIDNPQFSIDFASRKTGKSHLADITNSELVTAAETDDEEVTVLGNGSEPLLKIHSLIEQNTTYTLEIYNAAGQLVSTKNDIELAGNGEQIVPMNLPLIERGMFVAVLISNRKKKKSIKIAH